MSLRQLPRKPIFISSLPRPHVSSGCSHTSLNSQSIRHSSTSTSRDRFNKLLNRLPRFLHPYTKGLRNAPLSHVAAFLILHEITAIVPLVGFAGLFHYAQWVPTDFGGERKVNEGVERFGRYFRRKGWFGFGAEESGQGARDGDRAGERFEVDKGRSIGEEQMLLNAEERWGVGEKGGRILVEVATAYALTKVLLPVRVLVSVWGTPWFARVFVGRFGRLFRRERLRRVAQNAGNRSGAAGTGATSGGVIGKGL